MADKINVGVADAVQRLSAALANGDRFADVPYEQYLAEFPEPFFEEVFDPTVHGNLQLRNFPTLIVVDADRNRTFGRLESSSSITSKKVSDLLYSSFFYEWNGNGYSRNSLGNDNASNLPFDLGNGEELQIGIPFGQNLLDGFLNLPNFAKIGLGLIAIGLIAGSQRKK
ncbi:MAG: hypothetical protein AAF599_05375 [Bacteroidota bacterium]